MLNLPQRSERQRRPSRRVAVRARRPAAAAVEHKSSPVRLWLSAAVACSVLGLLLWSVGSSDTVSSAITASNAARGRPDSSEGSLVNLYPVSALDTRMIALIHVAQYACTAAV
eukprot:16226-Heterococcus_DN1.PRE.1